MIDEAKLKEDIQKLNDIQTILTRKAKGRGAIGNAWNQRRIGQKKYKNNEKAQE